MKEADGLQSRLKQKDQPYNKIITTILLRTTMKIRDDESDENNIELIEMKEEFNGPRQIDLTKRITNSSPLTQQPY